MDVVCHDWGLNTKAADLRRIVWYFKGESGQR